MMHAALQHPKTKLLQKFLKVPLYQVVGLLESLWLMTAQYADDGDLSRLHADQIAAYLEWESDPAELIDLLVKCGWLDRDGDQLRVHDWEEHCPKFVRDRRSKRELRSGSKDRRNMAAAPTKQGGPIGTPSTATTPAQPPADIPNPSPNVAECRRQSATPSGQSATVAENRDPTYTLTNTYTLPPTCQEEEEEGLDGLVSQVKARGVDQASKAVRDALGRGRTVDEIQGVLRHYDSAQSKPKPPRPGLLFGWLSGTSVWPSMKPPPTAEHYHRTKTMAEVMR